MDRSISSAQLIGRYLIAYVAWAVLAAAGFWLLFQIRSNILDILTLTLENPDTARDSWVARAIDRWYILLAGAVWIFCVMLLEGYLRNSVSKDLLFKRLARVVLFLVLIAAGSLGLQALM